MSFIAWIGLLVFIVSPAATAAVKRTPPPVSIAVSDYPLDPGLVWRYRTQIFEENATGRMIRHAGLAEVRVLSKTHHGRLTVAALSRRQSGDVPGGESEEFFYVVADSSRVYSFTDPERLAQALSGAPGGLDPGDAELDFPLTQGKLWGHADMLERGDGLYVNSVWPAEPVNVPAGRFPAVPIGFRTLPDQMTTWISPGIGIVRYEYLHHGSTSRELRELVEFRRAEVDTSAIIRAIDHAFDVLAEGGSLWARRSAITADPVLRALLGPITPGQTLDLDEGARRAFFHAASSSLVFEQLPDGPEWGYIFRWKNRAGVVQVFLKRSGENAAAAGYGDDTGSVPPGQVGGVLSSGDGAAPEPHQRARARSSQLEITLAETRDRLEKARRLLEGGREAEAGMLAESAISRFTEGVTGIGSQLLVGLSAEEIKNVIRGEAGDRFLTTRYGRRVRVDDGRLHAFIESAPDLTGIEVMLNGDSGPPVGAAPRVIRSGPGRTEVFVLRTGEPSAVTRKIVTLDWMEDPASPEILLWNGPGSPQASIELYRIDSSGARLVWQKPVPSGSARLLGPRPRLELEYQTADPGQPWLHSIWREIYAAPARHEDEPTLLSRELTNPWIATVARLIGALRAHDAAALEPIISDPSLRDRLAATWLADETVALVGAHSNPAVPGEIPGDRRIAVSVMRSGTTPPAEAGPQVLTLMLTPLPEDGWAVVDLNADPAAPWDQ